MSASVNASVNQIHGTTIVCVRRNGRVALGGDGQVTFEDTIVKHNAKKLRRLEALLIVADAENSLLISGTGDVIEPEHHLLAIGSGGAYAQAAALALHENTALDARAIVEKALTIAGKICIYTNTAITIEEL